VEAVTDCQFLLLQPETFSALTRALPEFRARLEERIAQFEYKDRARVPSDIAQENLPAGAEAQPQVDASQVDRHDTDESAVDETPFEEEGRFIKRGRRIRRIPFVRQVDEMDCGAACLAMVTRYRSVVRRSCDATREDGLARPRLAKNQNRQIGTRGEFMAFNAAALSDTLLDSQLFGHERGAFTGAQQRVKGKFELADGGTLFLDEVGDLTPAAQSKILRAVETGEYERLRSETLQARGRTADISDAPPYRSGGGKGPFSRGPVFSHQRYHHHGSALARSAERPAFAAGDRSHTGLHCSRKNDRRRGPDGAEDPKLHRSYSKQGRRLASKRGRFS
jgi:hypothetical protein